ncbi:hypothetical protein [Streptomyces sp. NPDC004629]|uniref:hypothetical protein n=1 Tax=Streptomyces sp. NPDC004629 TaxID=3364705 RepID=UPI00368F9210
MSDQSTDASIRSRYLEQAASDLQENRRRQQELAERVSTLKQEEALLLDILNIAERFDTPSDGVVAEAAPLPQQAQAEPVLVPAATAAATTDTDAGTEAATPPAPRRRARAARAVAGPKSATKTADKTADKAGTKTGTKAADKSGTKSGKKKTDRVSAQATSRQPLLGDVFLDLLRAHDEPRLAKELREELVREHPERTPTPQVVRNTLEALVAKGRIQRHKQQRSVLYSLAEPTSAVPAETEGDTSENA